MYLTSHFNGDVPRSGTHFAAYLFCKVVKKKKLKKVAVLRRYRHFVKERF